MQPQFNEGIVVLENRRLVNSESGNLDFPRRKSGVRVSSAPPFKMPDLAFNCSQKVHKGTEKHQFIRLVEYEGLGKQDFDSIDLTHSQRVKPETFRDIEVL